MEAYGNRGVSTNSKQSVNIVWRPLTTGHVVAICRKHIQKFHLVARIWHVSRNQDKHVNIIGLVIHSMIFPPKIAMSVSEWMINPTKSELLSGNLTIFNINFGKLQCSTGGVIQNNSSINGSLFMLSHRRVNQPHFELSHHNFPGTWCGQPPAIDINKLETWKLQCIIIVYCI
jgi:hypothetical protein